MKTLKHKLIAVVVSTMFVVNSSSAISLAPTFELGNNTFKAPYGQRIAFAGDLQGAWYGTNGKDVMMLVFMNNMVGLNLNNQQVYGNFSVQGNTLNMQFQNGKSLSYTLTFNNPNEIVLDGSVVLKRQNLNAQGPGTQQGSTQGGNQNGQSGGYGGNPQSPQVYNPANNGGWGGNPQSPQGGNSVNNGGWGGNPQSPQDGNSANNGGWGGNTVPEANPGTNGGYPLPNPDQTQPPMPQQNNILVGSWNCQTPQGVITFVFTPSYYTCFVNGQQTEVGNYQYDANTGNLNYKITSGQQVGMTGTNRVVVNGQQLTFYLPNGLQMVFQRAN